MSIARYMKSKDGLREYIIFLEEMIPSKRERFASMAKAENPKFVEEALKYVLTFDRLLSLPDMEITEVFASVAPKMVAYAIRSLPDEKLKHVSSLIPTNKKIEIKSYQDDNPSVQEQNIARFACIKQARALEASGLLKSIRIPQFTASQFY
jgi:flagellar motor switch protein FliG